MKELLVEFVEGGWTLDSETASTGFIVPKKEKDE